MNKLLSFLQWLADRLSGGQGFYGKMIYHTNLSVKHFRNGELIEERPLGSGVITNAAVNLWAADWTNATATIKLANFHDSGTGSTAPTTSDSVMQTPTGNARQAGAQSNTNNVYQTVGTLAYGGAAAITEWGLFTAVSGPTMFDHRTFGAISVVSGDTIQFTYALTLVSGG